MSPSDSRAWRAFVRVADTLVADFDIIDFLAMLTALQGGLLMTQTRRDTVALETVLDAMIDRIRQDAVG